MTDPATDPVPPAAAAVAAAPVAVGIAESELIVRGEGSVRWISLNRPASRNGLTIPFNRAIMAALDDAAATASVRAVVLTGENGVFCSGLDLRSAGEGMNIDTAGETLDRYFHGLIRAVRSLDKPVIALVDGAAAGFGCDLALACDIRLGTPRARFGEVFVKRGLMPDGGGSFHLPRIVGLGRALEMLYTGDFVDADEAHRIGLLNRIFPVETAAADALAYAQRIAAGPPLVHARVKRAAYGALDSTLDEALSVERTGQVELLKSKDFFEGVSAFMEKRPPVFKGE
jgi:enoyl-CoA hydratase/carnithine racemase